MDGQKKTSSTIWLQNVKSSLGRPSRRLEDSINPLTPNGPNRGRTAPLTSKVAFYIFIQQI